MRGSIEQSYFELLKTWLDALIGYQLPKGMHPALDGAILCPACSVVHGRCHDAVYPLLYMADAAGDKKYQDAALRLFDWAEYMLCEDGSIYNDSQSEWSGVTVFAAISLYKSLSLHSGLLSAEYRARFEQRFARMSEWLLRNIRTDKRFNINYIAANAAAMAMAGEYFGRGDMRAHARTCARFVCEHISESGLIYGEGRLERDATPKHLCAVDMGYNVEETLPSLYEYAHLAGDDTVMQAVKRSARAHLEFILPDGALDNSFGTRNFKWTYWGSRTSDGCQALFNALGREDAAFSEAAYRNLLLYKRCTHGLLYGGPDYRAHGELACTHHAFCHAKALAQALDEGVCEFERTFIPSDARQGIRFYQEIDTYVQDCGKLGMTLTGSDYTYMRDGHASGGCITLLYSRKAARPIIACATTGYYLREAHNQQLSRRKGELAPMCPRLQIKRGETLYSQMYDQTARIHAHMEEDAIITDVRGTLADVDGAHMEGGEYTLIYRLMGDTLTLSAECRGAELIIPLISEQPENDKLTDDRTLLTETAHLKAAPGSRISRVRPVFNLAPGFRAVEAVISADSGDVGFELTAL
ncbi:MAG: hypothetical protein IKR85_06035 [Clostridia bacterium]|nr:hypothetical protein [Clostridia bacterium]